MKQAYLTLIFLFTLYFGLSAQTSLTLNVDSVKTTMENRGAGFCNSFITDRAELTPNLIKTQAGTLRFPMGSLGKNYLFHNFDNDYTDVNDGLRPRICSKEQYFSGNGDINTSTFEFNDDLLDFDEFMVMCDSVGAEPVMVLSSEGDLLEGSMITEDQLLRNAIEWVKYAKAKGYNITYWEFGNEVHFKRNHSLLNAQEYAERYLYLQDTLKKIDPNIKLGAVTVGFKNYEDILEMLKIPELAANMDFFVTHQYNVSDILDYATWRNATEDIINPAWDNTQDDIRDVKRAIKHFDDSISVYPNLANMEYFITEYSSHNAGPNAPQWAEGGQHITQSISGFQQLFNMFLYDQRVKYTHFWVTTSPWGNRALFDGDAEAFNVLNDWEITPQGMTVLLFNKFLHYNLIQPVANGTVGCYASSSADGQKLTLYIINKDSTSANVNITLSNYTGNTTNVRWIYSGGGDPYDKNPVLRQFGSAQVNAGVVSTSLEPISLTIIELGTSPTTGAIPGVPNSLETSSSSGFGAAVEVSFEAVADAEFYELERKIGSGAFETLTLLDSLELSFIESPVDTALTYTYRVRAGNTHGYSAYSTESVIKPEISLSTAGVRLFNGQGTDLVLDGSSDTIVKTHNDINNQAQEWSLVSDNADYFWVINSDNGKYLTGSNGIAMLTNYNASDSLRWEIILLSGTTYRLQLKSSQLNLAGGNPYSGDTILVEAPLNWRKQEWTQIPSDDTTFFNVIYNGNFEKGGPTGPPTSWAQSHNSAAYAQSREGTWNLPTTPPGAASSLSPNGTKAFGVRVLTQNMNDPFNIRLHKAEDGDLRMRNKTLYEIEFLAKSNLSANISLKAEWVIEEDSTSLLADTTVQTPTMNPDDWTTFKIPLFIEEEYGGPTNVFLQFGFADNPTDTYIMIDDIRINKILTPPTGLKASNITGTSLDLVWNPLVTTNPITSYEVYRDGAFVTSVTDTNTTLNGLTPGTAYQLSLKAIDNVGNLSAAGGEITVHMIDTVLNPLVNGDFELGDPTAPPSFWSQVVQDTYAQSRQGTWNSLEPHGTKAYGVRVLTQNANPFHTRLYKPSDGDLYLSNKSLYEITFLARNSEGDNANISLKAEWLAGSNPVLVDTVFQTDGCLGWQPFKANLLIDENAAPDVANVLLQLGFSDNASETYIMIDDMNIVKIMTAPTNLSASNITSATCDLSWNPASSIHGIYGYDIYKDGVYETTVTDTTATITGLGCETTYNFTVKAIEAFGKPSATSNVVAVNTGACPVMDYGVATNIGSASWTTINLNKTFSSPVIVATPNYSSSSDASVTRITNITSTSFDLKLDAVSSGSVSGIDVHYLVVEEGTYNSPKMEALSITSDSTNYKGGGWGNELMEQITPSNTYTNPVVLGQVMSYNDSDWSAFWCSDGNVDSPPSSSAIYVGKHVGEDTDQTRSNETLGLIIVESGSGLMGSLSYEAGLGTETVQGLEDAPPYNYSINSLTGAHTAVLSQAGMVGADGSWGILYDSNPITDSTINLAVDEDMISDTERKHIAEQIGYFILASSSGLKSSIKPIIDIWASENEVSLYPNPLISSPLTINLGGKGKAKVTIYDMNGRIVFAQSLNTESLVLDANTLKSGLYIVDIIANQERKSLKLIVE